MRDLQLVIFDCDGVLVDSEIISNDVLARSLTDQGLPTTLTQARRDYQGLLLADIDSRAQAKLGRPLAKDWLQRYERDRAAVFRRELRAVPAAAETVQRIRAAGVRVCVASQGKLSKTRLYGFTVHRCTAFPYTTVRAPRAVTQLVCQEEMHGCMLRSCYGPSGIAWPVLGGTLPAEGLDLRPAVARIAGSWSRVIVGG